MRLVSIEPRPGTGFVEPVLLLDISIGYPMGQKVPLDLLVTVRSEGKIIGTARPSAIELGTTTLETPAPMRVAGWMEVCESLRERGGWRYWLHFARPVDG